MPSEAAQSLWERVDELVDGAPGLPALRAHRLQLLAGRRWRELGREVPEDLRAEEQLAALRDAIAPDLLTRVRAATDQPVVLLKGPEIARRYPSSSLRPSIDLDLLAPDAERLQAELLAAGFDLAEDPVWAARLDGRDPFAEKHHCHPLRWAGWPLRLEVHRRPSWPAWLSQPPASELIALARPAEADGILVLPPGPHALVLAAHLWVSNPFARLRDLLDIALLLQEVDRVEVAGLARAWGIARMWGSTQKVTESVLPRRPGNLGGEPLGPAPREGARTDRGGSARHTLGLALLGAPAAPGRTRGGRRRRERPAACGRGAVEVEGEAQPSGPWQRRRDEVAP